MSCIGQGQAEKTGIRMIKFLLIMTKTQQKLRLKDKKLESLLEQMRAVQ